MSESIYGATEFLPNLPGYRIKKHVPQPGGPKRVKMFRIINGLVFPKDLTLPHIDANGVESRGEASMMALGSGGSTALASRPESRAIDLRNVNVVLSFQAHFIQRNPNGTVDSGNMTRKVNLYFYIEDGTMSIVERPQMNSGVPQGTICARSVVWKADGSQVIENDFVIGGALEVFGQVYFITDCDHSTRRYFQRSAGGVPDARSNARSVENHDDMSLSEMQAGSAYMRGDGGDSNDSRYDGRASESGEGEGSWGKFRSKKNSNKTFMEAQLGNTVNNNGRDGFMRYGNKSLKFRCVWDNTAMLYGDMVEFSLVYFLADDTVEIFSAPSSANQSKEQFSRLLQRSKLPKKFGFQSIGNHAENSGSSFYHWSDLFIGLEMDVYARCLRIVDADYVTREFFEGFDIPLAARMEQEEPIAAYHEREIPPSTGFGSEEDSLRSCQGPLLPGPPRIKKLGENRVLTYLCTLESGGPDACNRRFVMTYFVQDQTIKIEEKPIRNSGFVGGVFLSRRVIQYEGEDILCEKYMHVGALVTVFKHQFRLLETDEVTLKWMEDKGVPVATFACIIDKLRCDELLLQDAHNGQLAAAFKENSNESGVMISKDVLTAVFQSYNLLGDSVNNISEHEIIAIVRSVGDRKNCLNYSLLIDQIISPSSYQ